MADKLKIGPEEIARLSLRVNQLKDDFHSACDAISDRCGSLIDNIKTKQLTSVLNEVQSASTQFSNLLYEDLNTCADFMAKKAESYATIDETLSKELANVEDLVDNISIDDFN